MFSLFYDSRYSPPFVSNFVLIMAFVSDPPEITLRPRNQQVKAGGIAAFYCAARGDPAPVIQWRKNGKKVSGNFPLIKTFPQNKHRVQFLINNITIISNNDT